LTIILGGSTNAVLHLIAIAHSVGIKLDIEDFQKVSDRTPFLADLKPSGKYVMEDVYKIGGIPSKSLGSNQFGDPGFCPVSWTKGLHSFLPGNPRVRAHELFILLRSDNTLASLHTLQAELLSERILISVLFTISGAVLMDDLSRRDPPLLAEAKLDRR
jgi:hypothetical protein